MQKHSRVTPEGRAFWYTERLWALAEHLAVETIEVESIRELDENCWFSDPATCRDVARHARQILEADLSFPILLHADGGLMDGGHRLAKAWLEGRSTLQAQRFVVDPEPDYLEAVDEMAPRL